MVHTRDAPEGLALEARGDGTSGLHGSSSYTRSSRLGKVVVSPNIWANTEPGKMRRQKNTFQTKDQDKPPEKVLSEMDISNLSNKVFKVMVIKMFTKLGRRWMNTMKTSIKREKI